MDTAAQLFTTILKDIVAVQRYITADDQTMLHYHIPKIAEYKRLLSNISHSVEGENLTTVHCIVAVLSELYERAKSVLILSENNVADHLITSKSYSGNRGRPKALLPIEIIISLNKSGMSWSKIAQLFKVSPRTLKRYRIKHNIQDTIHPPISNQYLDQLIIDIKKEHPTAGYVYVWSSLKARKVYITWKRLKERMRIIDPIGIHSRLRKRLKRRKYRVKGANYLWHMDGNEKLVRWHFYVHGCMDGHSHKVIYLKLAHDKKADTVFSAFLKGTNNDGLPARVRGDGGTENNTVRDFMQEVSTEVKSPFLMGRSVHNVRIERLWREVNRIVTKKYKYLFRLLEIFGYLNPKSELDLLCLSYIFYPRINKSLQAFKASWNLHGLSTELSRPPNLLWIISMLKQLQERGTVRNIELVNNRIEVSPLTPSAEEENENNMGRITLHNFQNLSASNLETLTQLLDIAQHIVPDPLIDDNADGLYLYLELRECFQATGLH